MSQPVNQSVDGQDPSRTPEHCSLKPLPVDKTVRLLWEMRDPVGTRCLLSHTIRFSRGFFPQSKIWSGRFTSRHRLRLVLDWTRSRIVVENLLQWINLSSQWSPLEPARSSGSWCLDLVGVGSSSSYDLWSASRTQKAHANLLRCIMDRRLQLTISRATTSILQIQTSTEPGRPWSRTNS